MKSKADGIHMYVENGGYNVCVLGFHPAEATSLIPELMKCEHIPEPVSAHDLSGGAA